MLLCLDIGGSSIKAGLSTSPGQVTPVGRRGTPAADFDAFVDAIAALVSETFLPDGAGVAISIAGVVDPENGVITVANIPGLNGRSLRAELSARLGRPVMVANDADCFALAEAGAGAGRGYGIVFGAILGTGVGGGLVIGGKLVEGAGGISGEWGHGTIVDRMAGHPPVAIPRLGCGCGREGCLDTVGGARGLERLHEAMEGDRRSSEVIIADWKAGDPAAIRTIDRYVELVAGPLALVVNITGAGIVPVGGGLGNVPELIVRLDVATRAGILRRQETPLVVPAIIGPDAGLVGASFLKPPATAP